MRSKSIRGSSVKEIQLSLEQSMEDGFKPTLAVVFISIKQDRNAICEIISKSGIEIIGATSCTEFTDGHQSEGETVILLCDINRNNYSILFEEIGERTIQETAADLANKVLEKFTHPSFIICSTSLKEDGSMLDGETLIRSLEEVAGSQVNIFGGMAGDDMTFTGPRVFTNDRSTSYGVAALVLNEDKIEMHGVALSGWKAIGVSKIITKSHKNLLYEIDGKPALEMYLRFLGEDFDATQDQSKFFDGVGLHYPLQIERSGREPMMCNPMGYNKEENALVLESEVEEGASFRFSTPPDFDIVETVVDKAKEIRKNMTKMLMQY